MTDYVEPFQARVKPWLLACFGRAISDDQRERNHRFLEEALELVQAAGKGTTREEAHMLVDYVFDRPVGETQQEVGGVMVTLAALCLANGVNMHAAGDIELERVWTKIAKIRDKQAAKPKNSPLPSDYPDWRQMVVWGFYEGEEPEFAQGRAGEHELASPVTAEQVAKLFAAWKILDRVFTAHGVPKHLVGAVREVLNIKPEAVA
jgi:NTP pyrophosphatase (non-canonical NTP hydrolase)